MKKLVSLMLAGAAALQAGAYTTEWSAFDSGHGRNHNTGLAHAGQFNGWFSHPLQSATYAAQAGTVSIPIAEPAPAGPARPGALSIVRVADQIRLAWPLDAGALVIEAKATLDDRSWTAVPGPYRSDRTEQFILLPLARSSQFYRLSLTPETERPVTGSPEVAREDGFR